MIVGFESVLTPTLNKATSSSITAGSYRVSEENRKKAIKNEIKLMEFHQDAGHQTLEEFKRSELTIEAIRKGHRRFNLSRGYVSHAEMNA